VMTASRNANVRRPMRARDAAGRLEAGETLAGTGTPV
jgi:hypothetical protein